MKESSKDLNDYCNDPDFIQKNQQINDEKDQAVWIKNIVVVNQQIKINNKDFLIEQKIPVSILIIPNASIPSQVMEGTINVSILND